MALPRCARDGCQNQVKREKSLFCSHACYDRSRRYRARACERCVSRPATSRDAKYCESCYNLRMAETRQQNVRKAQAKCRELRIGQFRDKLISLNKKSEIAREFYKSGYWACYSMFMRKIRRGDIQVIRERPVRKNEAA